MGNIMFCCLFFVPTIIERAFVTLAAMLFDLKFALVVSAQKMFIVNISSVLEETTHFKLFLKSKSEMFNQSFIYC